MACIRMRWFSGGFTRKSWKQNPLKMARWDDTGCIITKDNSYSCMDTECICTSTVLGKHACIPADYQIPSAQVIAHFQIWPILTYLSYLHVHPSCVDMFCNYPSFSQQPGNACIPRKWRYQNPSRSLKTGSLLWKLNEPIVQNTDVNSQEKQIWMSTQHQKQPLKKTLNHKTTSCRKSCFHRKTDCLSKFHTVSKASHCLHPGCLLGNEKWILIKINALDGFFQTVESFPNTARPPDLQNKFLFLFFAASRP